MNARENIKVPSLKKGQRRTSPKKEVLIPNHGDFFILAGLLGAILLSKVGKSTADRLERESSIQLVADEFFERQLEEKLVQSGLTLAQAESFVFGIDPQSHLFQVNAYLAALEKITQGVPLGSISLTAPGSELQVSFNSLIGSTEAEYQASSTFVTDEIVKDLSDFDYSFTESESITLTFAEVTTKNKDEKDTELFFDQDASLTEIDKSVTVITEVDPAGSYYFSPVAGGTGGGGGGGGGGGSSSSSSGGGGGSSSVSSSTSTGSSSSGGAPAAVASNYSGSVIDGYVSGATVFSDLNGDLKLNWIDGDGDKIWDLGEGEVWTTTDAVGA